MVSFVCDECQTTLKKAKVRNHGCRGSVSCVDCLTTFHGNSYEAHTSCISEAEKYEGKLFKGKKQQQPTLKPAVPSGKPLAGKANPKQAPEHTPAPSKRLLAPAPQPFKAPPASAARTSKVDAELGTAPRLSLMAVSMQSKPQSDQKPLKINGQPPKPTTDSSSSDEKQMQASSKGPSLTANGSAQPQAVIGKKRKAEEAESSQPDPHNMPPTMNGAHCETSTPEKELSTVVEKGLSAAITKYQVASNAPMVVPLKKLRRSVVACAGQQGHAAKAEITAELVAALISRGATITLPPVDVIPSRLSVTQ